MQYFIPAWYQNGDWKENEQVWYRSRTVTEFDDTVKQIQLFFRKKAAPFKIMQLGFSPNFRHFLHRQGVYHVPYWSCFDAMQGIASDRTVLFSFHDLSWPDDVEFIYSPFAVIVRRNQKKYAQIEFAEDGNMFRVDMFKNDDRICSNYYDDRGFMSCQIVYRDGIASREQYFNEDGVWKFARFLDDGHVLINPDSSWYFVNLNDQKHESPRKVNYQRLEYPDIDAMITEVLQENLKTTSDADIFVIAVHSLHSPVLAQVMKNRKTILSFFARRLDENGIEEMDRKLMQDADAIVADKNVTARRIQEQTGLRKPVRVITPYDSREESGNSLHLPVQNILLAVDQINDEDFNTLVVLLANYILTRNHRARVCMFTRSSAYNRKSRLMHKARKALRAARMNPELAREDDKVSESRLDFQEQAACVFSVAQCVDEMTVSQKLREQRIVVDLQPVPDQFLQISAMSMGIPQIAGQETDYFADGKNGILVRKLSDLPDALDYYLGSIAHVNQAQIASYELGSRFSTEQLVQSWKEILENVEH
ncbi:accessory Sec system protein Asp1 [Bilifractor sp. LCP21S3_A7]|uniref:accessory Sec system protein Asp1 n=1 Tax=Bilifractor sp. LCP21S3_A7 TaxID=3438738 RepID=UPI003F8F68BD